MRVIVTDQGFADDDWRHGFVTVEALGRGGELPGEGLAVELPNDRTAADLVPWLDRVALIRVAFPANADGGSFAIGRQLRELGYSGRLRAAGPLVADQFRLARRAGFDEIELPDPTAERQPEPLRPIRPQDRARKRRFG